MAPKDSDPSGPRIAVRTYGTRREAETAQALLYANRISSVIEADDAGGAFPFLLAGAARLLVRKVDADAARAALEPQGLAP